MQDLEGDCGPGNGSQLMVSSLEATPTLLVWE